MKEKPVILIVDDQPENTQLLEAYLVPHGYEIATATSGEEALETLAGNHVDLILLDVMMPPGIDGFEVTRRIRQDSENRQIPIILITALRESEDRVKGIEAGCDDFLSKPFDKMALFARVRSLLKSARLEASIRQIQKAESLGRMTGGIAHHFNNQLHAVMGHIEMAIEDLPPDTADVLQNLNKAMKAVHKAADVSGLMLTCLGQTIGRYETLDVFEVCSRSLPMLQAAMPKNVILETGMLLPGPVIRADAGQIQQVMINLITNGWEAIGDGQGNIHLNVSTVSQSNISASHRFPVEWQPLDKDYGCLEIRDTGCGIEERDIDKLFDPFFSSKFTGRGLGLSVVLGIVKERGGAVTVESRQGKGSVFRLFFPLYSEPIPLPLCKKEVSIGLDKAAIAPEIRGRGTVLIVDDDESVCRIGVVMLTRMGFRVLTARDGIDALEVFGQHQDEIRLVLCDISMPRMNGWQTMAALRKLVPDIPVILASGYDESQLMADDHSEFCHEFLHKPYRMSELKVALEITLEGKPS